jgi:hypothetical protein
MGFAERYMRPGGVVPVGDWRVKQYLVTVTSAVLDSAVVAAATAYLPKPLPSSAGSDATPRVAFSVPHKGVDAIWLNLHGLQPDSPAVDPYLADFLPDGPVGGP